MRHRDPRDCFKCGKTINMETEHWVRLVQYFFHWECWMIEKTKMFKNFQGEFLVDEEHKCGSS